MTRVRRWITWAGLDRTEWWLLGALGALSMVVIAALLTKGREITGADGLLASDQLQYFTWIRQAGDHILVGNEYDMRPDNRVFLHPGFLISGLLHRGLGISVPLSYLLWKPVAVGVMFAGALAYARRFLPAGGQRHAALILSLFAAMPVAAFVAWSGWGGKPRQYTFDFITGEMWSGQYLWGYLMTGIAVFLMPFVLLAAERRRIWLAGGLALLVAWLQPWQGGTLALIVVVVEAIRWRRTGRRPQFGAVAVPVGVAIPAIYYFLISKYDAAWELAGKSNAAGSQETWHWPWWAIVLALAPLAVPAALAYRLPARDWQATAIRVWPFAALVVYLANVGTFPYHAFQGIQIPLAILAVQGVVSVWPQGRPYRALALGALALMTLPGIAHKLDVARNSVHVAGDPYFIFPDEQKALTALEDDPRPGGVLATTYDGHMIPYKTGREVYVGALSWTPDWGDRVEETRRMFEGDMSAADVQALTRRSGARFVFTDCRAGLRDVGPLLGPLLETTERFGCATVYVLKR